MTHSYFSGAGLGQQLRRLGLTALLAGGTALAAQAQTFAYTTILSYNVAGTYTDLGSNGTAISTVNTDDANSAAQNIGFSFTYNGTAFTQFIFNTNGIIRLGSTAPSTAALYYDNNTARTATDPLPSTNAADVNLIMPFNQDLIPGSNAAGVDYRVLTSGTAPNRVCTIQWRNVADKPGAGSDASNGTQFANFSFQLKLYETTNNVEFVYGTATASTSTAGFRYPNVGLKGSANTAGQVLVAVKNPAAAWSATTFQRTPYGSASHAIAQGALPDAGRTYRFVTPSVNDAAVYAIYTLGKLPTAALPHVVQAAIVNLGTATLTNQSVTLTVSGANTFTNTQTIPSLQAGYYAVVSFAALPATMTTGINNVTVTVPTDNNTNNNSLSVQQTITSGTFSNVASDQTTATNGFVIGAAATGGIYATKYTTQKAGTVTSVSVYIAEAGTSTTSTTSVGKTVYGVVLSPTGSILGQSANYVIQASDINTYKTFAISTPPAVAAGGSFLAGLAQPVYTGVRFYPMAIQSEVPTRSDTYFSAPIAGGTLTDLSIASDFGRLLMEANLSVALATSKELQRAVTVYPNPSESGIFNLAVQAANAASGLGVEVTNQLGQRVYTGTARDNNTTKLDLSNLAPGIYHLQVRNGQEYTSSQLSIVK